MTELANHIFSAARVCARVCVLSGADCVSRGRGCLPESSCLSEREIPSGHSADQGQLEAKLH